MIIMEKVRNIDLNNNHYNLYIKIIIRKKYLKKKLLLKKIFMKIKKI